MEWMKEGGEGEDEEGTVYKRRLSLVAQYIVFMSTINFCISPSILHYFDPNTLTLSPNLPTAHSQDGFRIQTIHTSTVHATKVEEETTCRFFASKPHPDRECG
jgi:hypothetical protein